MNNFALIRTLIIYAISVPLAIMLGVLVTSAGEMSSRTPWVETGLLVMLLLFPILLRWHHPLMVFCWNMPLMVFFLPAQPKVWLPMMLVSLGISIMHRTVDQNLRFISAPSLTWPLLVLGGVAFLTAKLTGGIGLRSMGSQVSGGMRYINFFCGILCFFALSARRIPPERAGLYIGLFLLSGCFAVIGDLYGYLPSAFNFLFWFFPANYYAYILGPDVRDGSIRFGGLCLACSAVYPFLLARYGVEGIFLSGRRLRLILFAGSFVAGLMGGFRSFVISFSLIFGILFYLERMHRTKLVPLFIFGALCASIIIVPFSEKLPFTIQRALSFLPMKVSLEAEASAESSSQWRIQMWQAVLPQVPHHLLLGKGYALSAEDFQAMEMSTDSAAFAEGFGSAIAGDYHNGALSVILPLGVWGVIAFAWLLIAGGRAMYNNYRYGDPALKKINALLFAMFLARAIPFPFMAGALYTEILVFAGYLGMSVSLNGGICRCPQPVPEPQPEENETLDAAGSRWQPALQR